MSAAPGLRRNVLRLAGDNSERRDLLSECLAEHDGVVALHWIGANALQIDYRLHDLQWETLEALSAGVGADPLDSFWERIRRRWLRFSDGVAREYLSRDQDFDYAITQIYVSRYRQGRHGRRDDRKHNWRAYSPERRHGSPPDEPVR